MIGKLLGGSWGLWIVGGLLAAVVALSGALVVQDALHDTAMAELESKAHECDIKLDASDGALQSALTTNASANAAVSDLAGKLDTALKETERLDGLLLSAETELHYTQRVRDEALAALQSGRGKVYASDASCGAWGAAAVCGRITGSVLDQWRDAARRR